MGNHHFVSLGELIASGNIYKWTKPLDNAEGSCTMEVRLPPPEPHWSTTASLKVRQANVRAAWYDQYKPYGAAPVKQSCPQNVDPKSDYTNSH